MTDATRPLRLAVVGLGRIAVDYLAVLVEMEDLEIVGLFDLDSSAREREAARTDAPAFSNLEELVEQAQPEAALVLTPPATHPSLCIALLESGVHVLCEKPIAVDPNLAAKMFATATRRRRTLMMASKFRYMPEVIEASRLLDDGLIGEIVLGEISFCSRVDMGGRWNSDPDLAGGGVLIDNGCHAVDLTRCLLGPVVRVLAHFGRKLQAVAVEDTVRLMLETAGGKISSVDLSWSLDKHAECYARFLGSRGTLEIGWQGGRYRLGGEPGWHAFGSAYDKRAAFRRQLENFFGTLRGRAVPSVGEKDALHSVRVIEAAYHSACAGRWVAV